MTNKSSKIYERINKIYIYINIVIFVHLLQVNIIGEWRNIDITKSKVIVVDIIHRCDFNNKRTRKILKCFVRVMNNNIMIILDHNNLIYFSKRCFQFFH